MVVSPTGFGKSLIFQLLVLLARREKNQAACVLVLCPLTSIINDQIQEVEAMGLCVCNLSEKFSDLADIGQAKFAIVYSESAIDKRFLESLKFKVYSRVCVYCSEKFSVVEIQRFCSCGSGVFFFYRRLSPNPFAVLWTASRWRRSPGDKSAENFLLSPSLALYLRSPVLLQPPQRQRFDFAPIQNVWKGIRQVHNSSVSIFLAQTLHASCEKPGKLFT